MRQKGLNSNEIMKEIRDIRKADVQWPFVFNSICSEPLHIGVEAFIKGLDTNLGDNRIFKGTAKVENKVIELLKEVFHGPDMVGNIVSGGTEANFLALQVAKKMRPEVEKPEILFTATTHYSVLKAIEFMGLKYKIVETDENFSMDISDLIHKIGKDTIAIVVNAGSSELGCIDPIEQIAEIARENKIYLHVDAATGGFIIPFAKKIGYSLPEFDFAIDGVSSITVDPHKYGLAPIPAGGILFKNKDIQNYLTFNSYFYGTQAHTTLSGTRGGASVLAVYAILEYLGMEGFIQITKKNYESTEYLIKRLEQLGYTLVCTPQLNIVTFYVDNAHNVMNQLETKGFIVSVSRRFKNALRIVINNHLSIDLIDKFVEMLITIDVKEMSQ
ncbi:tyrosine decarboxylase MfnA [Paenibacillus sp. FSL L8-0436]|uniref:tyrosine decarboxylase MfnA n=1 Tax=Paenibacillus sp. FSL L8-0436 TaxID=2954686 RepID=UPI003159479D